MPAPARPSSPPAWARRPRSGRARRRPAPLVLARLRRRPVLWWLAALVLSGATAHVVGGAVARAEAGAASYGTTHAVLVTTRPVEAGSRLDPGVADVREVPVGFVPDGSVGAEALGSRVRATLHAGEVVHGDRLAPAGLSVVAARLPPGTRGLAVPTDAAALPLEVGDLVDVLATLAELGDVGTAGPTATVAAGALVVDVEEGAVTVAVPEDDAARVTYAISTGIVTLALVPG